MLFRIALTISAIAIAVPALAQAVTGFDGHYGGVSLTTNGGTRSCVAASPFPDR